MITIAQYLNNIRDLNELLLTAELQAVDVDQNWQQESTTFTFDDGSILWISGCERGIK